MENINIVIDFGLPVKIDLTNDLNGLTLTSAAGTIYGATALAEDGLSITYTPTAILLDKDIIELILSDGSSSVINIIPATSVYYEDSFLSYSFDVWDVTANDWAEYTGDNFQWVQVANDEKLQGEDRPSQLNQSDANRLYGYDDAYSDMSSFSLNGYHKATVDYDHSAVAEFVFSGTGFDIISMVNTTTGAILVDVIDEAGAAVKQLVVDTYYNHKTAPYQLIYTYTEGAWNLTEEVEVETLGEVVDAPASANEGDTYVTYETKWVVDADASKSMWQVPVMKVADLDYGTYTVKIRAQWDPIFEHRDGHNSYDFYLDAIRIYNGAGEDTIIQNAYVMNKEGWPEYHKLCDKEYRFINLPNYSYTYANTLSRRIYNSLQGISYEVLVLDNKNNTNNINISTVLPAHMLVKNFFQLIAGQSIIFKTSTADKLALCYQANNYGDSINFKLNGELKTLSTATPMYYLLQEAGEQIEQVFILSMPKDSSGILTIYDLRASSDNQEHSTVFEQLTRDELTAALAQIGYPLWDTYEYLIQRDTLEAMADALRNKNNITTNINPTNIAELIDNMSAIIGIENETLSLTNVVITDETITI